MLAEDAQPPPPKPVPDSPSAPGSAVRYRYVRLRPHRGSMVMGIGIGGLVMAVVGGFMALSLYFCCPLWLIPFSSLGLSIPAWTMGKADLAAMDAGLMEPEGRSQTQAGMICGIVGTGLIVLGLLGVVALVAIYAIIVGMAAASSASGA